MARRRGTDHVALFALLLAAAGIMLSAFLFVRVTNESADRSDAIQASRRDSVRASCVEQNERHDLALDGHRFSEATVMLIDALAPRRNCQARVRQLVP